MNEKTRRFIIVCLGIILPILLLLADILFFGPNVSVIIPLITWIGFFVILTQPFQD